MIELLTTLTLTEAIMYIVLIALAAKEFLSLKDFFKKRTDAHYEEKDAKETMIENLINEIKTLKEEIKERQEDYDQLNKNMQDIGKVWAHKEEEHRRTLQLLLQSDRDAIKSFIVKEHHYFIEQGWIDDFSLDTLEKRYACYKEEGGNSYVEDFIKEIRELPNRPLNS